MTFPTSVRETPEHVHHIEAQEREIEAKEEIIRLQADEISRLTRGLAEAHEDLRLAVQVGAEYVGLQRPLRVHGGQRA